MRVSFIVRDEDHQALWAGPDMHALAVDAVVCGAWFAVIAIYLCEDAGSVDARIDGAWIKVVAVDQRVAAEAVVAEIVGAGVAIIAVDGFPATAADSGADVNRAWVTIRAISGEVVADAIDAEIRRAGIPIITRCSVRALEGACPPGREKIEQIEHVHLRIAGQIRIAFGTWSPLPEHVEQVEDADGVITIQVTNAFAGGDRLSAN